MDIFYKNTNPVAKHNNILGAWLAFFNYCFSVFGNTHFKCHIKTPR